MTESKSPVMADSRDAAALLVVVDEVRSAPRSVRCALWATLATVAAAVVLAIADMATGTDHLEVFRLTGLVLAATGCGLLALAQLLNQLAQGRRPDMWAVPVLRFSQLHPNLVATPFLCTAAALLMALAIGLIVPSVPGRPLMVLPVVIIAVYLVLSVRAMSATSRFLYRHAREQAEAAARAEQQATEAQLAALQAQMNPHFLFNALNTVAALVRTKDDAAEETVEHLAEVLRHTLDRTQSNYGTVAEEVDYLRAYLAVEQKRYGDRLQVWWDIDPTSLEAKLPPLTVQPLVENAIKHGIGGKLEGGRVAISVIRNNGHLQVSVADNGVGFPMRYREGTGLSNVRKRLQTLYGNESSVDVHSDEAGSRVTLRLPSHMQS